MIKQDGLVALMVVVSAADGNMTDAELTVMTSLVRTLPVFEGYDLENMREAAEDCASYLERENGLQELIDKVKELLPPKLRLTAYSLACDVAAADGALQDEELEVLEILRRRMDIERLYAAAIEKATAARFARL